MRILTEPEVRGTFGDPTPYMQDNGEVSPKWESSILVTIRMPAPIRYVAGDAMVTRVRCHRRIAAQLAAALADLHANAEAWASVGDWGGCYCFRAQRNAGARVLSRHSWGIAVDLDCADNPMGSAGRMHPGVIATFAGHGFAWGGDFGGYRRDPMHFEFADLARVGD